MPGMHSSEGDDSDDDEKENDEPSDGNKMPGLADMDDNSSLPVKIDSIGCECFDGCNVLVKFISKIFHHCNVSVRVTLPKLYLNRTRFFTDCMKGGCLLWLLRRIPLMIPLMSALTELV